MKWKLGQRICFGREAENKAVVTSVCLCLYLTHRSPVRKILGMLSLQTSFALFIFLSERRSRERCSRRETSKTSRGKRGRVEEAVSSCSWQLVSGKISWRGNATAFLAARRQCWPANNAEHLFTSMHTWRHTDSPRIRSSELLLCKSPDLKTRLTLSHLDTVVVESAYTDWNSVFAGVPPAVRSLN